jgi:hypothetical protein
VEVPRVIHVGPQQLQPFLSAHSARSLRSPSPVKTASRSLGNPGPLARKRAGDFGRLGSPGCGTTVGGSGALDLGGLAVANTVTNNGGSVVNAGGYAGTQTFAAGISYAAGSTLAWELIANSATGPGTNSYESHLIQRRGRKKVTATICL